MIEYALQNPQMAADIAVECRDDLDTVQGKNLQMTGWLTGALIKARLELREKTDAEGE